MPAENGIHESTGGPSATYYQSESAQASATTAPLYPRTSALPSDLDSNDIAPMQSPSRYSQLYNELMEEVSHPNMQSESLPVGDRNTIPQSLRPGSHYPKHANMDGLLPSGTIETEPSVTKVNLRGTYNTPATISKKPSRKGKGIPRDSLRPHGKGSKHQKIPMIPFQSSDPRSSQLLASDTPEIPDVDMLSYPTSSSGLPQHQPPMKDQQYRAYSPHPATNDCPDSQDKRLNTVPKIPIVIAAPTVFVGSDQPRSIYGPPSQTLTSELPRSSSGPDSDKFGLSVTGGNDHGNLESPAIGFNDNTIIREGSFDPRDESLMSYVPGSQDVSTRPFSPFQDSRLAVGPASDVSPPNNRSLSQGADNSTPGSSHESQLVSSPPPGDLVSSPRHPFTPAHKAVDAIEDNPAANSSPSLQNSPLVSPVYPISRKSSFKGSEAFHDSKVLPGVGIIETFSPSDIPVGYDTANINANLLKASEGNVSPHNIDLTQDTRPISLNDAMSNHSNEKAIELPPSKTTLWKRRKMLIVVGFCVTLLMAGIGVGVFFALRKPKSTSTKQEVDTNVNGPEQNTPVAGAFRDQDPNLVDDRFVQIGTSLSAVTVGNGGSRRKRQTSNRNQISSTNFYTFYQHSNGEIRMARFQGAKFQPSMLVVTDSHAGTPIASYSRKDRAQFSVFYFDQQKILQEGRSQDGVNWTSGSLGSLALTSDAPSDLVVEYIRSCRGTGMAWLAFHTGTSNQTKLVYWNEGTDTWAQAEGFPGVKQGAGFASQSDADAWRFYYISSQNSQLSEMVCPDCCLKAKSPAWVPGIDGPRVTSSSGGVAVVTAGDSRLIYYQDADGTVRELESNGKYPNEEYQKSILLDREDNTGGSTSKNDLTGPEGSAVLKIVPDSKLAVAAGFRDSTAQLWLFAQWNTTSVSLTTRDMDTVGGWRSPVPVPVGR